MDKKVLAVFFILSLTFSAALFASEHGTEVVIVPTVSLSPTAVDVVLARDFAPTVAFESRVPASAPAIRLPYPLPGLKRSRDVGKSLFDVNLITMVGLNLADYLTTRAALKYPGLEESNPLMKPFVKSPAVFAAVKLGTTVLTYWSMKSIFKKNRAAAWVITTASNVLIGYVVANNLHNIQRAKSMR